MRTITFFSLLFLLALGCGKPAGPSAPAAAQEVSIFMYSEYISDELLQEFTRRTGLIPRISVYETTEEMLAKISQPGAGAQYDVIVASDHAIPMMAKLGRVAPLDHAKIPNHVNVAGEFANPSFDPGLKYCMPYQWGTMGLMVNKSLAKNFEPSWAMILDPERQPGPVVLIDSMRDMIGAALKFQGRSFNSRDVNELKAAGELVLKAKKSPKTLGFFGGAGGKNKVAAGEAAVAIVYSGDAIRAMEEVPNTDYVLPREGTLVWLDAMTLSAQARNPEGACQFMNFILDPKVGADLSNFNRFSTPNKASLPLINPQDRANPALYPDPETMKKLEYLEDIGETTRIYDEIWISIKTK